MLYAVTHFENKLKHTQTTGYTLLKPASIDNLILLQGLSKSGEWQPEPVNTKCSIVCVRACACARNALEVMRIRKQTMEVKSWFIHVLLDSLFENLVLHCAVHLFKGFNREMLIV